MKKKSIVSIDGDQLEKEFMAHADLAISYGEQLADAIYDMEITKAAMDVVEVEIKKDIRDHPEKYDLKKVTEDQVKSMYLTQYGYQKAQKKYFKAKHLVDLLKAATHACTDRRKMLEKLADYELAGLRARPKTKGREDMAERSKEKVRARIKIRTSREEDDDDDD